MLTLHSGKILRVRVNSIETYQQVESSYTFTSLVTASSKVYNVVETPEQIDKMLEAIHVGYPLPSYDPSYMDHITKPYCSTEIIHDVRGAYVPDMQKVTY